ncbi:hypothetical protein HJTV-2_gp52 [Haloarcula virus HJTV-2]|uniref:Uncharacterized protein n=2 Tax=Haloferacalesvirus TaxID=2843389 RepID=A0AAE8XXC0_9CAUD|nr:hypothetical protein M1M33_gp095 [Haloarcula virus HJTV-2]UBF21289.1 hypothetical protein HRTV-13_gp43 [Halorubrum phage HRTV-13]UBF21409.1 hypothetical protein HRTV-21_gp43 [Halorubrum virus HRTV-21]UBF21532.1 hypothetical protein HRTV-24_gp46 [Halorubrum virus HRTV-24]UBF21672.1 hypothetical protein HJTV-2_gp52 [Haloarcula virus HJTV-2]
MSGDDREPFKKYKTCLESGCDNQVGKEDDYCPLHRE